MLVLVVLVVVVGVCTICILRTRPLRALEERTEYMHGQLYASQVEQGCFPVQRSFLLRQLSHALRTLGRDLSRGSILSS